MVKNTDNVLSLTHEQAMDYFMKSEQYRGFELPEYFTFDEVLKKVRGSIGDTPYEACLQKDVTPDELSDIDLALKLYDSRSCSISDILKITGISKATLYSYIKKR